MEADSALVGPDGAVHLHTETPVDVDFTFVVEPWDTEHDDALRLRYAFEDFLVHQIGVSDDIGSHAFEHLPDCLVKLLFSRVSGDDAGHEALNIISGKLVHCV